MSSDKFDHSGSTFDSFLQEEDLLEQSEAVAIKRVIAWQLEQAMKKKSVTKQAMARHLNTSRSQIDRLLDPRYVGISLETMSRAAHAVGKRVQIQFVDPPGTRRKRSVPVRPAKASTGRLSMARKRKALAS